ncbi:MULTISPECIES: helix-turn-helix domain-containing protein [Clostridium]|uniref:XRE family transcriptional regulator n=1 Tax=Clostridium haemolyticum NCTC 9693 TaxID=1443114 RepID=A0ABR4TCW6_CLOHA|nr:MULTISPECIES: helix-turn-helix transcriptional regulator [Clostridium]KEH93255.1 XRE family transcriptional regulator [Clostridium botulinum C/D str. It1]KEI15780.1 XRE family transcriptional regulator [Clostridium haemolyticum NCTC 9693]
MNLNIGKKLKKLRNNNGYTLKQLSEICGLSISFISDIENNRRNPSIENLNKLADALDVSVNIFLDNTESKKEKIDSIKQTTLAQEEFKTPQEAMQFILKQPAIFGFGGFDINKMSDEEILDFANELLRQLKLISYKYKK